MEGKQAEVSLKAHLEEVERKGREEGREEGRKEGMAYMFAALRAADAGESQAYVLPNDYYYFRARIDIAMTEAADKNDTELLHFFLEAGADINFFDKDDHTALQLAVFGGQIQLVKALLKAGADPNLATEYFEAPLRSAVEAGNIALVKVLLAAGADIHSGD